MTDPAALHQKLWKLALELEGQLDGDAQAAAAKLVERLRADGWQITPDTLAEVAAYWAGIRAALKDGIATAYQLAPTTLADELVASLAEQAFAAAWPDGKTLSTRLWGLEQSYLDGMKQVLADGIRRGESVSALVLDLQREIEKDFTRFALVHNATEDWAAELASAASDAIANPAARKRYNQLIKDLKPYLDELKDTGTRHAALTVFKKIQKAVEEGNADALGQALNWWLYDKQQYLLKRIARTELATAQHRAVIESAIHDPDVIGFQWRLSSTHPEPDICDYYAGIEMGLGKGVWTKDAVPRHKAHPHCMCLLVPRVSPIRTPGAMNYADFIRNVTPERRNTLLPKWAREAMSKGATLEDMIRGDGFGLLTQADFLAANPGFA